jgi:hypothetical protein
MLSDPGRTAGRFWLRAGAGRADERLLPQCVAAYASSYQGLATASGSDPCHLSHSRFALFILWHTAGSVMPRWSPVLDSCSACRGARPYRPNYRFALQIPRKNAKKR